MPHKYNDSASAGASAPYESETTAATTLADALGAIDGADQIIWVKNTSAEILSANTTFTSSATHATDEKPQRIYGVSDWDSSPGTLANGAKISSGANINLILVGDFDFNYYDIDWSFGVSNVVVFFGSTSANSNIIYRNGVITLNGGSSGRIYLGPTTYVRSTDLFFENVVLVTGNNSQVPIRLGLATVLLKNLSLSTTNIATLISINTTTVFNKTVIEDSDLTGVTWSTLLDSAIGDTCTIDLVLNRVKIPSGVTIYSGSSPNVMVELINTSSGDVAFAYGKYTGPGSIIHDPSVYAASSPIATKSSIPYSVLMVSSATSGRSRPLKRSFLVPVDDNATVTPFVEFLVQGDGASALNTDDVYITAQTCTEAGSTLGSSVSSHPGLITAGSAISAGTVSYTGDGYTTERTHKLTTSAITARQEGYIKITVHLVKPSTGIYIGQFGAS